MRLCFLAHASSVHTRHWTRYFRDQGHAVSVVSLTPGESIPGIQVHCPHHSRTIRREHTNWHYLLQLPRLWRVLRDLEPDVLNAHFLSSYGVLGALVRPRGCPFVISLHGSDVLRIPGRSIFHRMGAQFAIAQADLVTSVAQHMTNELNSLLCSDKDVLTLQYGVDTTRFHPPLADDVRAPVCFSTRAMAPLYNIEALVLAACSLQELKSPLEVHLANNGPLMPVLRKKAVEMGLHDRVRFLGRLEQDEIANALRRASLYVSMSRSDGASLSLLEAMASGAFPVVSDIPANREWITHGVNGYLVPTDCPRLLALRCHEAWCNLALRREAADRNWSLIQERGDYMKNMRLIETAFLRLVTPS